MPPDEPPPDGFRRRPGWAAALAAVVVAQAGLALALFGPEPTAALRDDRPVTSGRHPLHLYHGGLGSQTFLHTGATACYDPAFQAGYPKTPVFDGGCRPAELVLALAGGGYQPATYKLGLFLAVLFVPVAFAGAARGAGLPPGAAVLAAAGGVVLGWSGPVRRLLDGGDLDVIGAGLAALVFVSWLAGYAQRFAVTAWAVLAVTAAAGWYAHPLVWAGLIPVVAVYYIVYAPRHGPAWHLGLVGVSAAGLGPNLWWLADWARYWWLRLPGPGEPAPTPSWAAVAGQPDDYLRLADAVPFGLPVAAAGLAGLLALVWAGHRAAAWLLGVTAVGAVVAARAAAVWPTGSADSSEWGVVLAAGLLLVPAAFAVWTVLRAGRLSAVGVAVAVAGLLVAGWADGPGRPLAARLGLHTDPLLIGLTTGQVELVDAVKTCTTADARVLWDEPTDGRPGWNWTALLPQLTGRAFLGGLDPDAGVEHWVCGQTVGKLNGRPLADWTDTDLTEYCRRYNVGWVVCRCPAAVDRWGRFPPARVAAKVRDGDSDVTLFALDRPRSFVLSGSATWEEATTRRIALTDVSPDRDGQVVLSLHHLQGMKVYPSYVKVEENKDPFDPVHLVQLKFPGPVPRVTLVWEP